jgi:hypothetical protein
MKLLFVSKLHQTAHAINTITNYVRVGEALGHEVAIFGEQSSEFPSLPHSLDVSQFDFAIFVVYEAWDFPDLPYLARLLDGMPKERRVLIDCTGRYNETIRVEHDFNHLEKLDGHQGWEWVESFQAVSDKILQPTLTPLREDVRPFLFFGYDPSAVVRSYSAPREAAFAWSSNGTHKPYGVAYVGNNWQRWSQVKQFLEAIEPLTDIIGPITLRGWAWDERPGWAVEHGFMGIDLDTGLLERLGVEIGWAVPFNEVIGFQGQARFCPVFHRPLFNHLGLITNRAFETFCSDTIPLLYLPEALVERIHGPHAKALVVCDEVASRMQEMLRQPEPYWDAVLKTRAYLAGHHSYERRFKELLSILES